MTSIYKGFRISVWVDDDTSHAKMLRGEKGPERYYCDIDPVDGAGKIRTKRLADWSVDDLGLDGDRETRLLSAARWWIDAPDEFEEAQNVARSLRKLKDAQRSREAD